MSDSAVQPEWKERVRTEPDFVALPGSRYSLARLLTKHVDVVPEDVIAKALALTPAQLAAASARIVVALRKGMGINADEVLRKK